MPEGFRQAQESLPDVFEPVSFMTRYSSFLIPLVTDISLFSTYRLEHDGIYEVG